MKTTTQGTSKTRSLCESLFKVIGAVACCWVLGCGGPEDVGEDLTDNAVQQERESAWFPSGYRCRLYVNSGAWRASYTSVTWSSNYPSGCYLRDPNGRFHAISNCKSGRRNFSGTTSGVWQLVSWPLGLMDCSDRL